MSLADRLQQLIESHENQIKQYESRIERMEKEINKNRGGIDEYHSFIEIEKEQINVIKKFLSFGSDSLENFARIVRWWINPQLKSSYSKKTSKKLPTGVGFLPLLTPLWYAYIF